MESLRDVMSYQSDDQARYRLAFALGGLAFKLILISQFAEAQTSCEEAQSLFPRRRAREGFTPVGNIAVMKSSTSWNTSSNQISGPTIESLL